MAHPARVGQPFSRGARPAFRHRPTNTMSPEERPGRASPGRFRHQTTDDRTMSSTTPFQETHLHATPIRNLGLTISGTRLEPILKDFVRELERAGIKRLRPHFYLST